MMNDRQTRAIREAKLRLLELKVRDYETSPEGCRASEAAFRAFRGFVERRFGSVAGAPVEVRNAIRSHETGAIERAASWPLDAA